ncbi:MAG TPA: hypothetical protein DD490_30685 [Acidobacteria bacterium]|nr:hypothetical protein [Acidobacteriota bacterium]
MEILKRWLARAWRGGAAPGEDRADLLDPGEIVFVICVEANRLEPQARLLCESLRTFGGRYRDAPILAVSPRPSLALDHFARKRLEALGVTVIVESLNETDSPYGTINRIVAGAWAEASTSQPYLVLLDTDTVFVGEPRFVRADVGVRPVDVKGAATSGPDDPLDAYWSRLCAFGGIDLERLPFLSTTIDRVPIRASYNGGFTVVRRDLRILQATRRIFFASLAENLRPRPGIELEVVASTGAVGRVASEWWGSSQAALSIAIWSRTSDVHVYGEGYNIPLHSLLGPERSWPLRTRPVLLHYHYLAEVPYQQHFREVLSWLGCSTRVRRWLAARLPTFAMPDGAS